MNYEMTKRQLERFLSRIDREGHPNGCWVWAGAKTTAGYGETWNGKVLYAHRVAYELWVGPIPQGFTIDHLCQNKACVNPDHLEACTQQVNILRSDSSSAKNARKTHCSAGHEFTGESTYVTKQNQRICRICRTAYMKAYRQEYHERLSAQFKEWWAKNRARQ